MFFLLSPGLGGKTYGGELPGEPRELPGEPREAPGKPRELPGESIDPPGEPRDLFRLISTR